jgi:hypothetical protein
MIEVLINLPSPIPKFQHTPLPLKCNKPGSVHCFNFRFTFESIKELGSASITFHSTTMKGKGLRWVLMVEGKERNI